MVAPSEAMVGIPVGIVLVLGQGFTSGSQVLVNGQPVNTLLTDSGTLEAQIDSSMNTTAGAYQFVVQDGGQVSNALPYTVYTPQQGPFVMRAILGFLVGECETDAPFIVAADIDGDGLADVIMPGPGLSNSASIAILRGRTDGTLSVPQYVPVSIAPYALAVLRDIFAEAVDQDFLVKDPARKVTVPTQLRDTDRTTLTWPQLRGALSKLELRDRILLELDMTNALRPGELFALRWRCFSHAECTMRLAETVYKGKIRPWGKTRKSLGVVHVPKELADDLWLWKQRCPNSSPEAFIFPNRKDGVHGQQ